LIRYVYWIEERSGVERVEKWTGDERQRVLPRIENAKYITFVNESQNQMVKKKLNFIIIIKLYNLIICV
jgi:hypothetical protein